MSGAGLPVARSARLGGGVPIERSGVRRPAAERGLVSAEFAVAILAALSLLLSVLGGVQLVVTQVRCFDTAAQIARQLARGDSTAAAQAERAAPTGSVVTVRRGQDLITVTVAVRTHPLGNGLPSVALSADAAIVPEPGAERG